MKIISYPASDIKSWLTIVITVLIRLELLLTCPLCSVSKAFKLLKVKSRKIYDLDDSTYDSRKLMKMRIKSDVIDILVMECPECRNHFYVFPDFIKKGTTLTLRTILYVAMVYESMETTWRDLANSLGGNVAIAHSVLYIAVHALGQTVENDQEMQRLMSLYPEIFPQTEEVEEAWPPEKSVKENTKKRELGVRRVLTGLYRGFCKDKSFSDDLFKELQGKLAGIFTNFGITLATLYPLAQNA